MTQKIKVGKGKYTFELTPLGGERGFRVMDIVAEIMERDPHLYERYNQAVADYRERHSFKVTKAEVVKGDKEALAKLASVGVSPEEVKREGHVNLFKNPKPEDLVMVMFPPIWKASRPDVTRLLGALVSTDEKVKEADKKGKLDEYLESLADIFRYEASLAEVIQAGGEALTLIIKELNFNDAELLGNDESPAELGETEESQSPAKA